MAFSVVMDQILGFELFRRHPGYPDQCVYNQIMPQGVVGICDDDHLAHRKIIFIEKNTPLNAKNRGNPRFSQIIKAHLIRLEVTLFAAHLFDHVFQAL